MNLPVIRGSNLLTHSRQSCFQTCRRKHYLRYVLGVRPQTDAKALRLGKVIHHALDLHAKGTWADEAITRATGYYDHRLETIQMDTDEAYEHQIERAYCHAMLAAYFQHYANTDLPPSLRVVEVVASELPFDLPIINPDTQHSIRTFRNAGKIDKIVRLADGRLAVMEHKTTSDSIEPGSNYWLRLIIDQQISRYMLAARALGYAVETVLYDVIAKPSHSPKMVPMLDEDGLKVVLDQNGHRVRNADGKWRQTANSDLGYVMYDRRETAEEFDARVFGAMVSTPERYFARREIPRLTADLAAYERELYCQARDMHSAQVNGWHFRNTAACVGFGSCEYLSSCANQITRTNLPAGFVAVDDLNPELRSDA